MSSTEVPRLALLHVGRAWTGTAIEDACPCPKAPCGLVDQANTNPECEHHPFSRGKSIRQGHPADACPGPAGECGFGVAGDFCALPAGHAGRCNPTRRLQAAADLPDSLRWLRRTFAAEDKLALAEVHLEELKARVAELEAGRADLAVVADQLVDHTARAAHDTCDEQHPLNLCPHLDSAGAAALRLRAMVADSDGTGPERAPASTVEPERPEPVHDQGERSTTRILGTTDGRETNGANQQ